MALRSAVRVSTVALFVAQACAANDVVPVDCGGALCGGVCVDTETDLAHCGDCDQPCAPPNAVGACSAGACTVASCAGSWADCDERPDTGCEADTAQSSGHCGGCDQPCTSTTRACVGSACATGRICIHAGEMVSPGSFGPGPVYVTVCGVCALGSFSSCERFFLCNYAAPSCGGCLTGFADGTYFVAGFVDTDGNAAATDPLPDSGDALPVSCAAATVTGGGTVGPVNLVITDVIP